MAENNMTLEEAKELAKTYDQLSNEQLAQVVDALGNNFFNGGNRDQDTQDTSNAMILEIDSRY